MSVKIYSLSAASTINSGDTISVAGNNVFYFSDWGSGWFMQDTTYIRSYNQKSIWLGAGILASQGGLSVGYGGAAPSAGSGIIAGNLSVGTSNPSAPFHVYKNTAAGDYVAYIQNTGAGNGLKIYNADWDLTDYLLYASNGGGYVVNIDGNGKVNAPSIVANNRTTLTSGGLYDNATNGNNIGIGFGASVLISTDGAGTYSAQNLGNATYPWASATFSSSVTATTLRGQKSQTNGDYTTAALWTESYSTTTTGIAFHINGTVGKFLEMRTNGVLYWDGSTIVNSGNISSYLGDFTVGAYRFIADYGSNTTWNIRSNGQFIWGRAHDWTQSFRLNLGSGTADNTTWATLGQFDSNNTNGIYRGLLITKFESGGVTLGDLSANMIGAGTDTPSTKIHAYQNIDATPLIIKAQNDATGSFAYSSLEAQSSSGYGAFVAWGASSIRADSVWLQTNGNYPLVFGINDTEVARFATDGYLYMQNWISFPNYSGLYSGNNGAHFYPNNGSYGSWQVRGSRNGWGGLEFQYGSNGNISLMISGNSNTTGFHNNSYGWQFLWQNGTLYVFKNAYGAGTQATVLDSVNYGSYALPLSGGNLTGLVQSTANIEATTFRTDGYFELTSALRGLKSNFYATQFYPSSTSYWNVTSSSSATVGALLFRQGYEGTTKGYIYWDSSGFGLLNNVGGWSIRANYGGSYGGYLNGSWGINATSPVTALDVEGGAYSNTTAKFGSSKPIYLVNNDPNIGFNLYYNSGWKYGAGSSSSFGGDLEFTSSTGDFSLKTSTAAGSANNTATLTSLMTWKQNGNVGINITAPQNYSGYTTLHINGKSTTSGGVLRLTTSDSSTAVNIYTNINGAVYDTTTAQPHYFNINGNTNLIVSGDGISTADPGNGAVPWKLGDVQNEAVSLVTNQYIEVEINGSYYRLALVEPA